MSTISCILFYRTKVSLQCSGAQAMGSSGLLDGRPDCTPTMIQYFSPEMILPGSYDGRSADIWSLGVITFTLLVGEYPFYHKSLQNAVQYIRHGIFCIPRHLSQLAKSMITSLLAHQPSERLSAWAILDHPWFKQ